MTTSWCLLVGVSVVATGCAAPDIVDCADGRVCPLGTLCVPGGCAAPGCGDDDVDAFFGEECDDGNLIAGDGCSPVCLFESCGNGVVDVTSEECDDGGLVSHDGCSSGCLTETATWHELVEAGSPPPRTHAASAWDADRGRAIVHGGQWSAVTTDEIWTFDGSWQRQPSGPPALRKHRMASDGAGSIVLFGGAPDRNECWVWNEVWAPCSGPLAPGRQDHGMTTVPGGGIALYGGTGQGDLRSTWRWNGAGWSDAGAVGPPPIWDAKMAYDRARGIAVLTGPPATLVSPQTWFLGTAGWTAIGAELNGYAGALVYDPDRRRILATTGSTVGGSGIDDLRELQQDRWELVLAEPRPSPRTDAVVFHDAIRRGLVVYGGQLYAGPFGVDANTTWILRWESATLDEPCVDAAIDADADGLAGCADPDCWGRCDPRCPPAHTDCAPSRPRCGDAVCNVWLETTALCPEDCP